MHVCLYGFGRGAEKEGARRGIGLVGSNNN